MSLFFEGPAIRRPKVRRLLLADFRSYEALDLTVGGDLIVLVGENGAGKTNILEAISLLTPGRGLRRADLADCAREGGGGGWALSVELEDEDHRVQLGSGRDNADSSQPQSRKCRIDRVAVGSARAFADHVRVVWLTPSMDGLFTGPAGDRRRFLDRLVLAVDAEHGPRVTALERALRNRTRLLEDRFADAVWLDAAEREIAGIAVAVAAARSETVSRLAALITEGRDANSPFPWADLALAGELESMIPDMPALEVEDRYRAMLRASRARDAAAGRTLVGPQASDLVVRHGPKNADAARSSTGEQKALLVGLVLAHARLVASMSGLVPLVLLDEIAAHFDPLRRGALYDSLADLGAQVWMTGADPSAFADLRERATILRVSPGQVSAPDDGTMKSESPA
jgi:DNA replication and repair protein RecF